MSERLSPSVSVKVKLFPPLIAKPSLLAAIVKCAVADVGLVASGSYVTVFSLVNVAWLYVNEVLVLPKPSLVAVFVKECSPLFCAVIWFNSDTLSGSTYKIYVTLNLFLGFVGLCGILQEKRNPVSVFWKESLVCQLVSQV